MHPILASTIIEVNTEATIVGERAKLRLERPDDESFTMDEADLEGRGNSSR